VGVNFTVGEGNVRKTFAQWTQEQHEGARPYAATAVRLGPGRLEKARSCLTHRVDDQRAI
jgi:hypothetical protein